MTLYTYWLHSNTHDLMCNVPCICPLQENSTEDEEDFYHGKVSIALKFSSPCEVNEENKHLVMGTLHVAIKQAKELPAMDANGLTDATVRCFLLPNISTTGKRKTKVVKNDLNPIWEEEFTYKNVTFEQLSKERVLEVTVWDYDRRGSNDFIGGLHLGPTPSSAAENKEWMDSIHGEISHWEAMLACPGKWVQRWHTLRPSMDPRASPSRKLSPTDEEEMSSPGEQSRTPSPHETKPIASVSCVRVTMCVCLHEQSCIGNLSFKNESVQDRNGILLSLILSKSPHSKCCIAELLPRAGLRPHTHLIDHWGYSCICEACMSPRSSISNAPLRAVQYYLVCNIA